MHLDYWNMELKPFESTPDPRFFFSSQKHNEGLMRLVYSIEEKKGAFLLTGAFGCGKTLLIYTLIREVLQRRQKQFEFALISNPFLSPVEMLGEILRNLGHCAPGNPNKVDLLMKLEEVLLNNMRNARNTVVIIDEAHVINDEQVFEEIRMLLNYHHSGQFLLTLLLVGQPDLAEKIKTNPALSQQIAIRYVLEPLSKSEAVEYIAHRMSVAGASPDIFTPESIDLIYEATGGIPRKINHVCDLSLLTGYTQNKKKITADIAAEAASEMSD